MASLADAGIPVALSTDTPFGDSDPWAAMRAAVHRITAVGAVRVAAESVSPRTALQMFLGGPTGPPSPDEWRPGQPGDLCVLTAPLEQVPAALDAGPAAARIIDGALVST